MSSATSSSKVTPSGSGLRNAKLQKQSKIVAFKISSSQLSRFPHEKVVRSTSQTKSAASSTSTSTPKPLSDAASSTDVKLESKAEVNTASVATDPVKLEFPIDDAKRKGAPGTKAKRPFGSLSDNLNKPRAKPGPKKRQRMDNGTLDPGETVPRPWTTPAPIAGHKVGPKANQGAINAGLRALDRTGKPCRKWEKKGFMVKSFTGVAWQLPSWRSPKGSKLEASSEAGQESTPTSNSETKLNNSSSNLGSEHSNTGNPISGHTASSPIQFTAIPV